MRGKAYSGKMSGDTSNMRITQEPGISSMMEKQMETGLL